MQLNGFDNFILKFPRTQTNTFTEEDQNKYKVWGIILPILSATPLSLIGLIIGLILFLTKKDESDYIKYVFNQQIWIAITGLLACFVTLSIIGSICHLWTLWLAVIAVYGNITGKNFALPLVGRVKIIKY